MRIAKNIGSIFRDVGAFSCITPYGESPHITPVRGDSKND